MKKFSRMPKSEGGGGGGGAAGGGAGGAGAASGSGGSSVGVRVFAVGRYQVTLEESLAEGTGRLGRAGEAGLGCGGGFSRRPLGSRSPLCSSCRAGRGLSRGFALQPVLLAAGRSPDKFKSFSALLDARK